MHIPDVFPRRGNWLTRQMGRAAMRLGGWRVPDDLPPLRKAVFVGAPHTSNWDFIWAIAAVLGLQLDIRFLGKHTLFKPPLGTVMRSLGGIPVKRSVSTGIVEQTIEWFDTSESLILGIAPEGTRSLVSTIKTGFYHIARGAGVPVVPIGLDYGDRLVHVGPTLQASGNMEHDLQLLRRFFEHMQPYAPARFQASAFAPEGPSATTSP